MCGSQTSKVEGPGVAVYKQQWKVCSEWYISSLGIGKIPRVGVEVSRVGVVPELGVGGSLKEELLCSLLAKYGAQCSRIKRAR